MQTDENSESVPDDLEDAMVAAARNGDLGAFEDLVRRYDRTVYRVARHITQNDEDAEDAVQDAFLKAFCGLGRFQGKARFSTWLYRITVNECLMKLRGRRNTCSISIDDDERGEGPVFPFEVADWRPNPEQLYNQSELERILARALRRLPPKCRVVFLLRDVEGFSTDDTAEALSVSVATVKARLVRARLRLRDLLGRHFQVPRDSQIFHGEMQDAP
jgi:RNA polymerase sigma-70 factor (ECF subfamily)